MGLKLKFSLFVSALIVILLASISVFLIRQRTAQIEADLIVKDGLISGTILPALSNDFANYFYYEFNVYTDTIKKYLAQYPEIVSLRIFSSDGTVLFTSNDLNKTQPPNPEPVTDPYVANIIKQQKKVSDLSVLNGQQTIRVYVPFIDQFGVYRIMVEFQFSTKEIQQAVQEVIQTFAILLGIFTTLGVTATIIFVDRFTRPIYRLIQGVNEISKGNLNYKVKVNAKDEVGTLANSFNKMTQDLKKSKEELVKYNEQLENQVRARSKELAQKVDDLERLQKITINRELKMVELKEELKKYQKKAA